MSKEKIEEALSALRASMGEINVADDEVSEAIKDVEALLRGLKFSVSVWLDVGTLDDRENVAIGWVKDDNVWSLFVSWGQHEVALLSAPRGVRAAAVTPGSDGLSVVERLIVEAPRLVSQMRATTRPPEPLKALRQILRRRQS